MLMAAQVNYKDSEINEKDRYKEGQPNSHLANDSSMNHPQTFIKPHSIDAWLTLHHRG